MEKEFKQKKVYKEIVERKPPKDALSKVYVMPGQIEVYTNEGSRKSQIRNFTKLPNGRYLNRETGEICESNPDEKKPRSQMNASFRRLRRLINNNFIGELNEIHITLTISNEYIQLTVKEINEQFKRFWKCFVYRYPGSNYVVIREISPRGRWHYHLLVKNPKETIFKVDVAFVQEKWGLGRVHVNHIVNNDNIGAYFTVFDSVVPWLIESRGKGEVYPKSRFIKEFPKSVHLFDKSRALKHPQAMELTYEEAEEMLKGMRPTFSKTLAVMVDIEGEMKTVNYLHYKEYKRPRRGK